MEAVEADWAVEAAAEVATGSVAWAVAATSVAWAVLVGRVMGVGLEVALVALAAAVEPDWEAALAMAEEGKDWAALAEGRAAGLAAWAEAARRCRRHRAQESSPPPRTAPCRSSAHSRAGNRRPTALARQHSRSCQQRRRTTRRQPARRM